MTHDAQDKLCGAPYPKSKEGGNQLTCLKPEGHKDTHATCLGYWPPWIDNAGLHVEGEYEWDEWEANDVRTS